MIQETWKNEMNDLEQELAGNLGGGGVKAAVAWAAQKERAELVKTLLGASSIDSLFDIFPDAEIFWDCAGYQKTIFGGGGLLKLEIKIIRGAQEVTLSENDFVEQVFALGWAQKCDTNNELLADIRNNVKHSLAPLFMNPSFDHVTLASWNGAKANPEPRSSLKACLQSADWQSYQLELEVSNKPVQPRTTLRI